MLGRGFTQPAAMHCLIPQGTGPAACIPKRLSLLSSQRERSASRGEAVRPVRYQYPTSALQVAVVGCGGNAGMIRAGFGENLCPSLCEQQDRGGGGHWKGGWGVCGRGGQASSTNGLSDAPLNRTGTTVRYTRVLYSTLIRLYRYPVYVLVVLLAHIGM